VLLGSVGIFAKNSSALTTKMRDYIASLAIEIDRHNRTSIVLYGYATTSDAAAGAVLLSAQRAAAVKTQLVLDLVKLNDKGVVVRANGEGQLSNSVLASFRNVEIFAS
jgi:outer membrane protein OmpA-like peptidoglycan-associated protein